MMHTERIRIRHHSQVFKCWFACVIIAGLVRALESAHNNPTTSVEVCNICVSRHRLAGGGGRGRGGGESKDVR